MAEAVPAHRVLSAWVDEGPLPSSAVWLGEDEELQVDGAAGEWLSITVIEDDLVSVQWGFGEEQGLFEIGLEHEEGRRSFDLLLAGIRANSLSARTTGNRGLPYLYRAVGKDLFPGERRRLGPGPHRELAFDFV